MTPLVPVLLRQVGASEVQTVDARELHAFLALTEQFSAWIARHLRSFTEGDDFYRWTNESSGGRPAVEYALTLDVAKHLAMLTQSRRGREVREYFIACEREALAPKPATSDSLAELLADPRKMLAAISGYAEKVLALEATVDAQRPAVEFAARVTDAANDQSLAEVAKILGTGRQRLIDDLLTRRILYRVGRAIVPHQEHIDAGRFVVRETVYEARGEKRIHAVTRVTGKGLLYLQKRLVAA